MSKANDLPGRTAMKFPEPYTSRRFSSTEACTNGMRSDGSTSSNGTWIEELLRRSKTTSLHCWFALDADSRSVSQVRHVLQTAISRIRTLKLTGGASLSAWTLEGLAFCRLRELAISSPGLDLRQVKLSQGFAPLLERLKLRGCHLSWRMLGDVFPHLRFLSVRYPAADNVRSLTTPFNDFILGIANLPNLKYLHLMYVSLAGDVSSSSTTMDTSSSHRIVFALPDVIKEG